MRRVFAVAVLVVCTLSGCATTASDVDFRFRVDPETRQWSGDVVVSYRPAR